MVTMLLMLIISGCASSTEQNLPYDMTIANKGYKAMIKQEYEEAEAFFELALSINPENPYAILNLGVIYHNTGRFEQAKEMYQKVIDLKPKNMATHTTDKNYKGKTLSEIAEQNLRSLKKEIRFKNSDNKGF